MKPLLAALGVAASVGLLVWGVFFLEDRDQIAAEAASLSHHRDPGPDLVGGGKYGETSVLHDDRRGVTCWEFNGGLSCLPDRWLAEGGAP